MPPSGSWTPLSTRSFTPTTRSEMQSPLDVFFFCNDPLRDPCAPAVFRALEQFPQVVRADGEFDGFPLLCAPRADGSLALFVRTQDVVSNDYARYAGLLRDRFGDVR